MVAETWEERTVPLAFVAIGALFSIKLVGRDAEDVVALDADAVNVHLLLGRGLGGVGNFFRSARIRSAAHAGILARRCSGRSFDLASLKTGHYMASALIQERAQTGLSEPRAASSVIHHASQEVLPATSC